MNEVIVVQMSPIGSPRVGMVSVHRFANKEEALKYIRGVVREVREMCKRSEVYFYNIAAEPFAENEFTIEVKTDEDEEPETVYHFVIQPLPQLAA